MLYSMMNRRLRQIEKRIEQIKAELVKLDALRPGSLTRQFKDPKKRQGAYYQLSFTWHMKSRTDYIGRQFLPEVRRQISTYKRFKALTTEWIDLGIEQGRLRIKLVRNF
jgi:hypothetical protein